MTGKGSRKNKPVLAMRVLELLTPVAQISDSDYMGPIVPGELITVKRGGLRHYDPEAYYTLYRSCL